MKIVVCIKQVPGVSAVSLDPETKRLVREGVKSILNPFDLHALEAGVRLKERHGGELVAISMGPPKAEQALREALALGADQAVLLCDKRFAGSDTWATSYVLARAIATLGNVGLVICGKQAIDGDTAQVGPGIAAHLGWPQATGVTALEVAADDGSLAVTRQQDGGHDRLRLPPPAVLAVFKELNQPRVPRLSGWLAAERAPVPVWNAEAIGADPALVGLNASPTRVVRTGPPPPRNKDSRRIETTPAAAAAQLFHELRRIAAI
ncbi:MAG: electron transfer flavoprotein subunit beta/FixA family protein [Lentisphaeria bacterium]|jgi:electron transfer flavoprotein beta subunit